MQRDRAAEAGAAVTQGGRFATHDRGNRDDGWHSSGSPDALQYAGGEPATTSGDARYHALVAQGVEAITDAEAAIARVAGILAELATYAPGRPASGDRRPPCPNFNASEALAVPWWFAWRGLQARPDRR